MVSQYNISDPDKKYGVKNLGSVVGKRIKMQGSYFPGPLFLCSYDREPRNDVSGLPCSHLREGY